VRHKATTTCTNFGAPDPNGYQGDWDTRSHARPGADPGFGHRGGERRKRQHGHKSNMMHIYVICPHTEIVYLFGNNVPYQQVCSENYSNKIFLIAAI
jgi:hypothetical protein